MKNKTRRISRILPALLAVMLCVTAFPVTALAGGNDPAPAPLPEATTEPATGGLEPETDETGTATDGTETEAEKDTGPLTGKDITDLFSALFGSKVSIAATDDGIQITTGTDKKEPEQTGTVTTNGGRLNVRTGAGLDKTAFTQLPNGTTVEVVGTDGDWIKILLPKRIGYVHSDYMTVSEKEVAATGEGGFSLSIDPEEIASLLELFNGGGASAALSPDGNLSLIDDIGSAAKNGKQFITVETKNGNVFYLIIDRDDEGKETVHFLNQVDEADLLTLMEDGETVTPAAVCSCTTKCKAGAVNTNCPVCKTNLTECSGPEPQEPQPEEPEAPEEEPKGGAGGLIVFLLVALAGGGAALYYFKFKKPKAETTGSDDLGEYDFGEDEDLEDEEPETEFDPEADFVSEQEDEE
ncbi:TPA: CD1107 family mobile element protein [Enterococcus faecium]